MESTIEIVMGLSIILGLWTICMTVIYTVIMGLAIGTNLNVSDDVLNMNINELKHYISLNKIANIGRGSKSKKELLSIISEYNNRTISDTKTKVNNRLDAIRTSHYNIKDGVISVDKQLIHIGFKALRSMLVRNFGKKYSEVQDLNIKPCLYRITLEPIEIMDWKAFEALKLASLEHKTKVKEPEIESSLSAEDKKLFEQFILFRKLANQ